MYYLCCYQSKTMFAIEINLEDLKKITGFNASFLITLILSNA